MFLKPVTYPIVECAIKISIILFAIYVNKAIMLIHSTNALKLNLICPLPPVMSIIVSTAVKIIIVATVCMDGSSLMASVKQANSVNNIVPDALILPSVYNAN